MSDLRPEYEGWLWDNKPTAKDAEIARLREENEVLKLRAGICYSGADLAAILEQTLDECEAIARKQESHTSGWMAASRNIAVAITALKRKGDRDAQ